MRYQWCLTPIISIVASYEVAKAVRYLSGKGYSKQLITIDAFNFKYEALNIDILKNKDCPVYEKEHYKLLETKQESNIESMCGNAIFLDFLNKRLSMPNIFLEILLNRLHLLN